VIEEDAVEIDANVLLALLAVRTLGGQSAPAGAETIKALKKSIQAAVAKGWLKEDKITETIPAEGEKPKTKKVAVIALTEEGERVLREAASAEALAASHASHRAAVRETQSRALADHLDRLRQELARDRAALSKTVEAALTGKGKETEEKKFEAELKKLSRTANELVEKVKKLEESQPKGGDAGPILARISEGFAALEAKLDESLKAMREPPPAPAAPAAAPAAPAAAAPAAAPAAPAPAEAPPAPAEPAPAPAEPPQPPEPEPLTAVLRQAYETLCRREFPEGMAELPKLYHEARTARPDLTVEQFRQEILELESQRALDLHLAPEAAKAAEPEKAIKRNEKLYYLVYWSPRP
jgi:hypothetical protein